MKEEYLSIFNVACVALIVYLNHRQDIKARKYKQEMIDAIVMKMKDEDIVLVTPEQEARIKVTTVSSEKLQ